MNAETEADSPVHILNRFSPYMDRALKALRMHFGFEALRSHQEAVLTQVFAGKDCLAVLPTGSGKTLCYALPALVRPGLVVVISPLIALIRDQARKFEAHGIPCVFLDSHQTPSEKDEAISNLMTGSCRILLVSPERFARDEFRARLKTLPVQLVAIDEAHCISQWGGHFRPDYRHLGNYLEDLKPVQKLAVTATATARVRLDIMHTLRLTAPESIWADFSRSNLNLKIIRQDKVADQLTAILHTVKNSLALGTGIIYAPTRKTVRELHQMLQQSGIAAGKYHAGMSPEERKIQQKAFMEGHTKVVVATNAFGLGIDKADIRFVHHAGLPNSLEQYVQEIGRAGRDGKPAHCHLIYGPRDFHIQKFMIDKSYPDGNNLRRILDLSRNFVAGPMGQALPFLVDHLHFHTKSAPLEISQALDILCREGLLTKLRAHGASAFHDVTEIMMADGSHHDEEFFRDYPLRKLEEVAKLEAVRAFVTATGDRFRLLDAYFRNHA